VGEELIRHRLLAPAKPRPTKMCFTPPKSRVLGEVLCEAVTKVTEALRAPFWHFWHPVG
jgi:hypothetical protein